MLAWFSFLTAPAPALLDGADEALQRLGAHQQPTVDEKGRDAWHPDADASLHVFVEQGMSSHTRCANKKRRSQTSPVAER
jgi:hypothetical protein